ncbi:helix-turn-helix domain-containing protein [Actinomadura latina]|uniref:Helix-turn-helix transcriptional regulator n=1 Tax=Actinomadura latina TaxID=163603 RepID=A0A846Z2U6_9ACTN|nr:helix-turn-helix transcriptional regulator [Actinomadura latina]NKZ05482.1 helix-turn-helix transcriptional regulator [Actinomadura latina]
MSLRDALNPDRSLWHFIAVHLRRYREAHSLSGQALADILDCDRSTVSRYESGLLKLTRKHAEIIDREWQTRGMFASLVTLAGASDEGDWFTGLTEYEGRASRIRMWETLYVPGLFQTPEYALATFTGNAVADPQAALNRRLSRQAAVFDKPSAPHLTAILNWTVLAQPIGPPELMREQLARLIELSEHPSVSIRIVERQDRAHPGLDGPFKIVSADGRDLAYTEAVTRGRFLTDPHDVEEVAIRYDRISDIAAPVGPSRALLAAELENHR